jgi:hypothetical protein
METTEASRMVRLASSANGSRSTKIEKKHNMPSVAQTSEAPMR